jgi:F420H(2)-dependent quinone reductase
VPRVGAGPREAPPDPGTVVPRPGAGSAGVEYARPVNTRSLQGAFIRFHQALYETSRGWVGRRLMGVPSLLLTTTGRRTGRRRTAVLVYAADGPEYVVVASNDGRDRPPAWLLNAGAEPRVEVRVGRWRGPATARVVGAGDPDYPRLWALVNANNHGRYDGYQSKTTRPIELMAIRPDIVPAGA